MKKMKIFAVAMLFGALLAASTALQASQILQAQTPSHNIIPRPVEQTFHKGVGISQSEDMTVDLSRLTQYNPISPVAAQYMRYGEIPVGLSTGVPEISIPIYTIEANGLQIPINISYHASGIKVKDVSGPVGLGWVLNAGGMIVQQIQGKEDSVNYNSAFTYYRTKELVDSLLDYDRTQGSSTTILSPTFHEFLDGYGTQRDMISDRYSYNFNGHVGTFRWETDGDLPRLVSVPHADLIMEHTEGGYKITDADGIVWMFSHRPSSTTLLSGRTTVGGVRRASQDYYLTSIEFPNSDEKVRFEYEQHETHSVTDVTESIYYGEYYNTSGVTEPFLELELDGGKYNRHQRYRQAAYRQTVNLFLTRIVWKDLTVDFNYDPAPGMYPLITNDSDLKTRLSDITIANGTSSDTIRVQLTNNTTYLGNAADNKRKLLSKIDVNGDIYSFGYNMTPLPTYTRAQTSGWERDLVFEDFWGYYNNTAGTVHIIPYETYNSQLTNGGVEISAATPSSFTWHAHYVPSREPDSLLTQAGILTKITYPTGGYTEFEYEQNRATGIYNIQNFGFSTGRQPSSGEEYFGGVRVKKITSYASSADPQPEIRRYEYAGAKVVPITEESYVSSQPIIFWDIRPDASLMEQSIFFAWSATPYLFEASTVNTFMEPGARSIMYGKVTEYYGSDVSVNGKTEHTFMKNDYYPSVPEFGSSSENLWSVYHNMDKGYVPHLPLAKRFYEYKDGNPILRREEVNGYRQVYNYSQELRDSSYVVGMDIRNNLQFINSQTGAYRITDRFPVPFQYNTISAIDYYNAYYDGWGLFYIYALPEFRELSSTTVREYPAGGGEIVTTTSYGYDPARRILSPIETRTVNSNGDTIRQTVTHPFDHTGTVYNGMKDAHILSPVITQTTRNVTRNTDIQAIENVYTSGLTQGVTGKTRYLPETVRAGRDHAHLEDRIVYHEYDQYGNPLHISKDGITNVVYIWSYKGERLIAQIENATAGQIRIALDSGNNILSDISGSTNPSNYITRIGDLRGSLGNEVLITTYTYDSRLRLTEVTDPRGSVTSYEYDDQNRLEQLAQDGKILETYDYHYRNN